MNKQKVCENNQSAFAQIIAFVKYQAQGVLVPTPTLPTPLLLRDIKETCKFVHISQLRGNVKQKP